MGHLAMWIDAQSTRAPFNMFLVGYGLDSFVGIFIAAVDRRSAALADATRGKAALAP